MHDFAFEPYGNLKLLQYDHKGQSSIPGVNEVSHPHGDRPRDIDYGTCMTEAQRTLDLTSWERGYMPVYAAASSHMSMISTQPDTMSISLQQENMMKGKLLAVESAGEEFGYPLPTQSNLQVFILVAFRSLVINNLVAFLGKKNSEIEIRKLIFTLKVYYFCNQVFCI